MIYEHKKNNGTDFGVFHCHRDTDVPPYAAYGPVTRDFFVLECCTAGTGSVVINGREFGFCEGDVFLLFPRDIVLHKTGAKTRSDIWCAFDDPRAREIFTRVGVTSTQPFLPGEAFSALCGVMEELIPMMAETDGGAQFRRDACLYRLFGESLRFLPSEERGDRYVREALRVMEMRYNDPDLDVAAIAAAVGLERCYFSTLFREKYGESPHRCLSAIRVEKALRLILHGDCNEREAANAVGIAPENFSRLFRRHIGKAPSEYIKNHRKKENES